MRPIILYRDIDLAPEELASMKKHFMTTDSRMDVVYGDLVIGRYSVLPFYREQEHDIRLAGGSLINTYEQHKYVADIGQWYQDLKEVTPETWSMENGTNQLPDNCSFVLKGETNSMKRLWNTHMFASDKDKVAAVYNRLLDDSLIGYQKIYARRYIPLKQDAEGLNGLPITREFRFFIAYGKILTGAYYWSSHIGDLEKIPQYTQVPYEFINYVINKIGNKCNFYTIDIAIREAGDPIVIEVNDGQMSGLSENNPDTLYKELQKVIYNRSK